MSRPQRLTAAFARTVTEPGVYSDGRGAHGLRLVVRSRSAGGVRKSWAQRLSINGRPLNLGLGPYPIVTLADARDQALANARDAYRGLDPRGDRQRVPTFAEAFETVVALHAANWSDGGRSEKQWRSSMATYVLPRFGTKSVAEVTAGDILAALTPLWAHKAETARRLKGRISAVLRWAVAQQYRPDDPTAAVAAALPSNNGHRGHFAALAHSDIPAALATIDSSAALPATKLVIRFLALTATRSSETRDATWSEINTNTATWDIPAARTKTRKPHRVPLSTQALTVLAGARQLSHTGDLDLPRTHRAGAQQRSALQTVPRTRHFRHTPRAALQLPQLGRRHRRNPRTRRSRPRPHRPRRRRRLPTQRPPPSPPPRHATVGRPLHPHPGTHRLTTCNPAHPALVARE